MNEKERAAVDEMVLAYNTDFAMQDEAKVRKIKRKFINDFTVDVTKNPQYALQLLETAYDEKNAGDVELAMDIIGMFDLLKRYPKEYPSLLLKLLEADWHYEHENIVWIFQQELKIPEAVNLLYETALKQFKYLEYDEFFALSVKCIWALGAIKTKEAIEKLELLAQSDNEIIKENALNQLEMICSCRQ